MIKILQQKKFKFKRLKKEVYMVLFKTYLLYCTFRGFLCMYIYMYWNGLTADISHLDKNYIETVDMLMGYYRSCWTYTLDEKSIRWLFSCQRNFITGVLKTAWPVKPLDPTCKREVTFAWLYLIHLRFLWGYRMFYILLFL